jgi:hypothetical protein
MLCFVPWVVKTFLAAGANELLASQPQQLSMAWSPERYDGFHAI